MRTLIAPLVYGATEEDPHIIQMKASDLLTAFQSGVVFVKDTDEGYAACDLIEDAHLGPEGYFFSTGVTTYIAVSGDEYPTSTGIK